MRLTVPSQPREALTKGDVRRLRRSGLVPITISTRGEETVQFAVPARELTDALHKGGRSALIELGGAAGDALVIARDVQREPISGRVIHVGFRRVSEREPITTEVAVRLTGEPEAVRTGTAVLEQQASTLQVRALPDRLPNAIDADTSGMELGGVLHVRDLGASTEYEIVSDPDTVLATVHTVRAAVTPEEEAEATEEEAGAQAAQAQTEG